MSLTIKESALLELRDTMIPAHKSAIDLALSDALHALKSCGLHCATDDREARLEAALIRFTLESNPAIAEMLGKT